MGPVALQTRPDLVLLMMSVVSLWSLLEQHIAMAFSTMLHGNLDDSFDIFHAFDDTALRRRVFLTMAQRRLPEELQKTLWNFFDSVKKEAKLRNHVAHGRWGASPLYPECILLLDAKFIARKHVEFMKEVIVSKGLVASPSTTLFTGMTVNRYYKDDFDSGLTRINDLSKALLSIIQEIIRHQIFSQSSNTPSTKQSEPNSEQPQTKPD